MTKKHRRTKGQKPPKRRTNRTKLSSAIRHKIACKKLTKESITKIAKAYNKTTSTISRNLINIKGRAKRNSRPLNTIKNVLKTLGKRGK